MKEINKVIVPIDFLMHTDQIVEYALYVSEKLGASLKLIHVIEPPQYHGYYGDVEYPSLETFTTEIVEQAEKMMKELVEKHRQNCAGCEGKVIHGNTEIVDSIIQYATDEQADLIIIGTHGRKGLEKMWLGSVAEQVIKGAPCPTLTCNPYKEPK